MISSEVWNIAICVATVVLKAVETLWLQAVQGVTKLRWKFGS